MSPRTHPQGLLLLLSRFSCVRLCATPQTAAHQAPRPWDSPGKDTGVGCHFLRQCMKVKSESEVAQSCPTLRNPMVCSLPGSSAHGIFQARVLELGSSSKSYLTTKDKQLWLFAVTFLSCSAALIPAQKVENRDQIYKDPGNYFCCDLRVLGGVSNS